MEVVNQKSKIQELNDNILSEVAGGLEVAKPLNIAVLTDDKIKNDEQVDKKEMGEILH